MAQPFRYFLEIYRLADLSVDAAKKFEKFELSIRQENFQISVDKDGLLKALSEEPVINE